MATTLATVLLVSCSTPQQHANRLAEEEGWTRAILKTGDFDLLAYYRLSERSVPLRVYIEHDGTPWTAFGRPSADPTPRRPTMLDWMVHDNGSVIYLGRPCYFIGASGGRCEPVWWTHRRFAPEIVSSMVEALRAFLADHPARDVELFGYSGGGVLAVLMAERMPEVSRVVTVGAPLDLTLWAEVRGVSPLEGSLDPAKVASRSPNARQQHWVGAADEVVPPAIVLAYAAARQNVHIEVVPGFDHYCCWEELWPRILGGGVP